MTEKTIRILEGRIRNIETRCNPDEPMFSAYIKHIRNILKYKSDNIEVYRCRMCGGSGFFNNGGYMGENDYEKCAYCNGLGYTLKYGEWTSVP